MQIKTLTLLGLVAASAAFGVSGPMEPDTLAPTAEPGTLAPTAELIPGACPGQICSDGSFPIACNGKICGEGEVCEICIGVTLGDCISCQTV